MGDHDYDVFVIGAGAAGCACAAMAAHGGLRVALIERQPRERARVPEPEWITPAAIACLGAAQVDVSAVLGRSLTGATFHSADLTQHVESSDAAPSAHCVDYAALTAEMARQAAAAGVQVLIGSHAFPIEVGEEAVTLVAGQAPLRARFLVLADGARPPKPSRETTPRWVVVRHVPPAGAPKDGSMHWVLGLPGERELASWWFDGNRLVFRLQAAGEVERVRSDLRGLIQRAVAARLVPCGADDAGDQDSIRASAAQPALEIDSHVSKNTLLIGEAGGFVASAGGEGIYPAVWSARLAADTLLQAAGSRHPQDELQGFDTLWRTTMGDYLRPPDTDTPFLLPIIFSNRRMADRMAAAFWRGENV